MVIKVVPYSSLWVKIFQEEANIIKDRLKEKCLDIYHIGSTSVYGLIAKPSVTPHAIWHHLSHFECVL